MSTKTIRGSVNDLTGDEIYITDNSKLKTLNQDMFDGLDEKWQYIGIEGYGDAFAYNLPVESFGWQFIHTLTDSMTDRLHLGKGFDTDDWENSVINRKNEHPAKWISVNDRLPDPDFDFVLACADGAISTIGYNKDYGFYEVYPIKTQLVIEDITHWMPLPQLPNLENEK